MATTPPTGALVLGRKAVKFGLAREIRRAAGLSQAELAAAAGIAPLSVARYEAGRRPTRAAGLRYCVVLDQLIHDPLVTASLGLSAAADA